MRRSRTGLLLLFVMPAILVVVITLVKENVMELTGQKKTSVLLLDLDQDSPELQIARAQPTAPDWDYSYQAPNP